MSSTEKYLSRGVSAAKEDVHKAIRHLDHGLYPKAFCKIHADHLGGSHDHVNVMSSDGSGTKSILAYLYWKETGDESVWAGIAQDVIVMNLDDLLCVGATGPFVFNSLINRNKHIIPGSVITGLIEGSAQFFESMASYGIIVRYLGGETADLGDITRTLTVDGSMLCRMHHDDLILTKNIEPGQVIVGLASYGQASYENAYNSGIGSNGLTSARHDLLSKHYLDHFPESFDPMTDSNVMYCGPYRLTDQPEGLPVNIGKALLSPTRSFAPVLKAMLDAHRKDIKGIIHNTGGAHSKVLHYIDKLKIIKDNLLPIPPIFNLIQQASNTDWKEMFKVYNCGTRMEIYCDEKTAPALIQIAKSFQIDAQVIGYVENADKASVNVIHEKGNFTYGA
jgi:phosphoribosylformylglycinamidine cyclo-ligase